jgi:hypothetical protein
MKHELFIIRFRSMKDGSFLYVGVEDDVEAADYALRYSSRDEAEDAVAEMRGWDPDHQFEVVPEAEALAAEEAA